MKLKYFILSLGLIMAQEGVTATQTQLSCKGKDFTHFSIGTDWSDRIGHIIHNYSSGDVVCPYNSIEALRTSGKIKCYGSWHYDISKRKILHDSLAWVEISMSGDQITAVTRTNRVYGQQIKTMNCSFALIERP